MSRKNTLTDEMIWFLYCWYLKLKSIPEGGSGQQVIFPVADYAAAEAIANGVAKIIVVAVDETNDDLKTTYFWDGTTLARVLKTPPLIKKELLDLIDPEVDKDPVTLGYLNGIIGPIQDILDALQNNSSQDILKLLDQLKALAYPTMEPDWNSIDVVSTGVSASGATVDTANGNITIPNGTTGSGSYIRKDFTVDSNVVNKEDDVITFEIIMRESYVGALNPFVVISLTKNGTAVPIEVTAVPMGPKVIRYLFDYQIDEIDDLLSVRVSISGSAPAATANTIYTWNSLAYTNPKERFGTLMGSVATTLRNADNMYTTFSRRSRTTKANIYNTTDNAALMQDEIYDAIQTSGVYILPKNAIIYIGSPLNINGSIRIIGAGQSTILNTALNGTLFKIATNDDVIFEDFHFYRYNGQFVAKAIEFNSQFQNKRTQFRNLVFSNLQKPVSVNYADNLIFDTCEFRAGQNGIDIGDVAPQTVKSLTIKGCKFDSFSNYGINSFTGQDMTIKDNFFAAAAGTSIYGLKCIHINVSDHVSENLEISSNRFKYFREQAIRLYTGGTGKTNHTKIFANNIEDQSSVGTSAPILVTSVSAGAAKNMSFSQNRITTKNDGITAQNIDDIKIVNNEFYKNDGVFASARGIKLINCPDPKIVLLNQYGADLQPNQL